LLAGLGVVNSRDEIALPFGGGDFAVRLEADVDAKEAAVEAKVAEHDANWAEADATDAIAFAVSAIVEAEYATLDALLARENAAQLAASSS